MTSPMLVAAVLAWWPYPIVDTCGPVLAVLGGGAAAEAANARLLSLGHIAVGSVVEGLEDATDPVAAMRLLEVLASHRDARSHAAIRPFVFHDEPELAAFATRVLLSSTGGRSLPTLEVLLTKDRFFEQTLAAIEGLRDLGLATTFPSLSRFFVEPGHDPILRALALDAALTVDPGRARKWLRKARLEKEAAPWLVLKLTAAKTASAATSRR